MIEIKASTIYKNEYLTVMDKLSKIDDSFSKKVIYKGKNRIVAGVNLVNWRKMGEE